MFVCDVYLVLLYFKPGLAEKIGFSDEFSHCRTFFFGKCKEDGGIEYSSENQ